MNRFVNLKSERGLTLIELLAVITISSLIIGGITSVLIMGVNTFNKTMTEGKIRDEADYLAGMVLKEIYEFSPDYIEELDEGFKQGMTAYKFQDYEINNNGVMLPPKGKTPSEQKEIYLEKNGDTYLLKVVGPYTPGASAKPEKVLNETEVKIVDGAEEESAFTIQFSQSDHYRESGQIFLRLYLQQDPVQPMRMESSFGF